MLDICTLGKGILKSDSRFGPREALMREHTFSSSRRMETLCPFGVPKVSNSMPDLAMRPVGLSDEEEDILRASFVSEDGRRWFDIRDSLNDSGDGRNMAIEVSESFLYACRVRLGTYWRMVMVC